MATFSRARGPCPWQSWKRGSAPATRAPSRTTSRTTSQAHVPYISHGVETDPHGFAVGTGAGTDYLILRAWRLFYQSVYSGLVEIGLDVSIPLTAEGRSEITISCSAS